jgi:hypothetical protein
MINLYYYVIRVMGLCSYEEEYTSTTIDNNANICEYIIHAKNGETRLMLAVNQDRFLCGEDHVQFADPQFVEKVTGILNDRHQNSE